MAKKQAETSTYVVLTKLQHDGSDYATGETVDLTTDQAGPLLEVAAIKPFLGVPAIEETNQQTNENQEDGDDQGGGAQ